MGGPMYWRRLVDRNHLRKLGYGVEVKESEATIGRPLIAGELFRWRDDQIRDAQAYADVAGCGVGVATALLRAVFDEKEPACAACEATKYGRCEAHSVYGRSA